MINNFMASGSLAQGMEVNEVPDEGDTMPFPREDAIITIYNGHPLPGMHRVSNPSLGPQLTAAGGMGTRDVRT
jgi:hypothetical protein